MNANKPCNKLRQTEAIIVESRRHKMRIHRVVGYATVGLRASVYDGRSSVKVYTSKMYTYANAPLYTGCSVVTTLCLKTCANFGML